MLTTTEYENASFPTICRLIRGYENNMQCFFGISSTTLVDNLVPSVLDPAQYDCIRRARAPSSPRPPKCCAMAMMVAP